MAKFGHVTGHKRERKPAQPWWAEEEEENIRRIEAEWQARQKTSTQKESNA